MRSLTGIVGLVAVLVVGYVLYTRQLSGPGSPDGVSPQQQIDVTGVRASLLVIGQAQRLYVNAHGTYGTLEQLRADGAPHLGADERGYTFSVEPDGAVGFRATATPVAATAGHRPILTIDETMEILTR